MGIGVAVFLLAAGAVLTFAVDASANGVDLDAVGVILMIAGAVGLLVDLLVFAPRRRGTVITADRPVRRTVRRDEIV